MAGSGKREKAISSQKKKLKKGMGREERIRIFFFFRKTYHLSLMELFI